MNTPDLTTSDLLSLLLTQSSPSGLDDLGNLPQGLDGELEFYRQFLNESTNGLMPLDLGSMNTNEGSFGSLSPLSSAPSVATSPRTSSGFNFFDVADPSLTNAAATAAINSLSNPLGDSGSPFNLTPSTLMADASTAASPLVSSQSSLLLPTDLLSSPEALALWTAGSGNGGLASSPLPLASRSALNTTDDSMVTNGGLDQINLPTNSVSSLRTPLPTSRVDRKNSNSQALKTTSPTLKRKASAAHDEEEEEVDMKSLSSKERRQIRNKISARNFRLRRKEYISSLEGQIKDLQEGKDHIEQLLGKTCDENAKLRAELESVCKMLDPKEAQRLAPTAFQTSVVADRPEFTKAMLSNSELSSAPFKLMSLINFAMSLSATQLQALHPNLAAHLRTLAVKHQGCRSPWSTDEVKELGKLNTSDVAARSIAKAQSTEADSALLTKSSDATSKSDGLSNTVCKSSSTPPTPCASPILTALSSPETLIGDDEFLDSMACHLSSSSSPFFATEVTNTPVPHSPVMGGKSLDRPRQDIDKLEHMLEDEFHRTLSLSLKRLSDSQVELAQ
ncbi:hypothetical protein IWQ62_000246 [Dispira parvispora]|uniref:BZIP domain-containing protein n=1 Tax=Dispira parvispora TaxID=1520584 RepID=A0A9W8E582_9FUNG|nr:hypothetical protein IWQ62_000246 [Dispira parvispora]